MGLLSWCETGSLQDTIEMMIVVAFTDRRKGLREELTLEVL